jgi:hypothetical protein
MGIDTVQMQRLVSLGITSYAAIAAWTAADVARIGDLMGSRRRVRRLGWIEQAAILATGATTAHARRVLAGDLAIVVPRPQLGHVADFEAMRGFTPLTSTAVAVPEPDVAIPSAPRATPVEPAPKAAESPTPPPVSPRKPTIITPIVFPTVPVVAIPAPTAAPPPSPAAKFEPTKTIADVIASNAADEEFPELLVDEASVVILAREGSGPASFGEDEIFAEVERGGRAGAKTDGAPPAAPAQKSQAQTLNSRDYAAYRGKVEEALVDIVRAADGAERPQPAAAPEQQAGIRRFLKALKGR